MLVVGLLIAEYFRQRQPALTRTIQRVVKARVVPGISFHQRANRRSFVRVEDGTVCARLMTLGAEHQRQAQPFMGEHDGPARVLRSSQQRKPDDGLQRSECLYLPGHGAPVEDGPRTTRAYLIHRQMREQAVLEAIRKGADTIPEIAGIVYSGIAPPLLNAARLSVQAHVEHLAGKRLLTYRMPLTPDRRLALSS